MKIRFEVTIESAEAERRRIREERRPKNAGVHRDQLKKVSTRSNRRAAKQRGWKDEA